MRYTSHDMKFSSFVGTEDSGGTEDGEDLEDLPLKAVLAAVKQGATSIGPPSDCKDPWGGPCVQPITFNNEPQLMGEGIGEIPVLVAAFQPKFRGPLPKNRRMTSEFPFHHHSFDDKGHKSDFL